MGHCLCKICGIRSPRSGTRRDRHRNDRHRSVQLAVRAERRNDDDERAAASVRRQRASRRTVSESTSAGTSSLSCDPEASRLTSDFLSSTVNEPYPHRRESHHSDDDNDSSTGSSYSCTSEEDEEESETRTRTGSSRTSSNRVDSRDRSVTLSDLSVASDAAGNPHHHFTEGATCPDHCESSGGNSSERQFERAPSHGLPHKTRSVGEPLLQPTVVSDVPVPLSAERAMTDMGAIGVVAPSAVGSTTEHFSSRPAGEEPITTNTEEVADQRYPQYWNNVLPLKAVVDLIDAADEDTQLSSGGGWSVQCAAALESAVPLVQWWDYCVSTAPPNDVRASPHPSSQDLQHVFELPSTRRDSNSPRLLPSLSFSSCCAGGKEFRGEKAAIPFVDPAMLRRCRAAWERAAFELPHHLPVAPLLSLAEATKPGFALSGGAVDWLQSAFPGPAEAFRERYRQSFYQPQETTCARVRGGASKADGGLLRWCRVCPRCRSCSRHVRTCTARNCNPEEVSDATAAPVLHSNFDDSYATTSNTNVFAAAAAAGGGARNASALGCRILATPARTLSVICQASLQPPENCIDSGWLSYDAVADVLTDFAPDWVPTMDRVVVWLAALPGLLDQVVWLQPSLAVDRLPSCLQLWCRPRRLPTTSSAAAAAAVEGSPVVQAMDPSLREAFEWLLIQQQEERETSDQTECLTASPHSQRIIAHCAEGVLSIGNSDYDIVNGTRKASVRITNSEATTAVNALCLIFSAVGPAARSRLLKEKTPDIAAFRRVSQSQHG